MATPRRLLFGEVAQLYDESRPTYPQALIDDLLALADGPSSERLLEVGAGTGKATTLVAAGGRSVLAIEPSPEMAAVARVNCARYPGVEIVQSDFERWDPGQERFGLLYSAQAWHWIDHAVGYQRARAALRDGAWFAALWNRPAWRDTELRARLAVVYREVVGEMVADGPMHPLNERVDDDHEWSAEIAAAGGFADAQMRFYESGAGYTTESYLRLLQTLSEVRLLEESRRAELLAAVGEVLDGLGGDVWLPLRTNVCLARAV